LPVEFHQRRWRVDFSAPKSTWYTPFDTLYPPLAGLAGAFTTTLLYLLFLSQATSRRRAVKLAEVMTLELRASQDELQSTNQRLRRLAAHAEHVKEEERKRIAREIHDDLAQILLSLKIDAEMLTARTCSSHRKLHERAADTLQRIDAGIRSVRHVINDLRPSVLDLGLEAAVDWQVAEFERRTGIKCELSKSDGEPTVRDSSAIALFRILQESLNNVARHAHATHVWISLQQQNDTLALTVRDDGIGLRPDSRSRQGSFGLIGMEERVHLLGGNFRIGSDTQGGTAIVVRIPVAPAEPVSHSPDRQLA
jgi:signal transduction histidine kinase